MLSSGILRYTSHVLIPCEDRVLATSTVTSYAATGLRAQIST